MAGLDGNATESTVMTRDGIWGTLPHM
jgi:hypothetical protein